MEIDVKARLPFLNVHFHYVPMDSPPGIIHQHVNAPKLGKTAFDQVIDLRFDCNVALLG
jgi:hypothetical protein